MQTYCTGVLPSMPRPIHFDGGSDADHTAVLAAHDAYLRANAAFDWPALKRIWSDDPTNVFFNMNRQTEQFERLVDELLPLLRDSR